MSLKSQGWHKMMDVRKWHYFKSGSDRSLCGKWLTLSRPDVLEDGNYDSPDNCATCRRKLLKGQS